MGRGRPSDPSRPRRSTIAADHRPRPEKIVAARLAAQLTQPQAAALLGRSLDWWQSIELGRRPMEPVLWDYWRLLARYPRVRRLAEQLHQEDSETGPASRSRKKAADS